MTDFTFFESQPDDAGRTPDCDEQFACTRRLVDLTHTLEAGGETTTPLRSDVPAHPEIIELIESLLGADPNLLPSRESPICQRVHSVYVPEHYEAGYAYPLVVWFHGDGESEAELNRVMPSISDRNYIGVALRGDVAHESGYSWSTGSADSPELLEDVRLIVTSLRRRLHIHSERIYLAGFGSGATTAIQLMLNKPEWFGGVISFSGQLPKADARLARVDELKNKRILLATSLGSPISGVGEVVAAGRLLYSAGMQVGTRVYQGIETRPTKKMLRDLDSWLMDEICSAA
jgi:phospholipase/carboxylesterase